MKKVLFLFTIALLTMSSAVANEKVETISNGVILTETVFAATGMSCVGNGFSVQGTLTDSIITLYDSTGAVIGRKTVPQAQGNGICQRMMQ